MLYIYGFFFAVGAVLLAFSLFTGKDADADTDVHVGGDADINGIGKLDAGALAKADISLHADSSITTTDASVSESILSFLSIRNLMFFGTFFGATGITLTFLSYPSFLTFLSSIGVGSILGLSSHYIFKFLKTNEILEETTFSDFIGMTAKVKVPVAKGRSGKIIVTQKGRTVEILAKLDEDAEEEIANVGEMVYIVSMNSNIATIIVNSDIS
ncbi:MAG: hypothetical protein JNL36_08180 [Candidatus Kapabacteria bacterium]|nr:hypothetical protein [Candidatus Kapabacteria bacterium]